MDQEADLRVHDTGLTILHDPRGTTIVADIILVHGLQGNPWRTWLYDPARLQHHDASPLESDLRAQHHQERRRIRSLGSTISGLARAVSSASSRRKKRTKDSVEACETPVQAEAVYWPKDLLPTDCPNARILVWGYDTVVTRGFAPSNKSNIFAHARDLLYSLERQRPRARSIIFVAHSLGGILVKEVLRRAQQAEEAEINDVIESTRAVVFLGTPHRGSDFARLGDVTRQVASTLLRMDSNATVIRALGLDSTELELSRESFLQQWRTYRFRVKTFQESLGFSGVRIGSLNEKIVSDISSSLDDPREHAEPLQADHRNMTKFWGRDDPNYLKVGGELKKVIAALPEYIQTAQTVRPTPSTHISVISPSMSASVSLPQEACSTSKLSQQELACLKTLSFTGMMSRQQTIHEAQIDTCGWFLDSDTFKRWHSRANVEVDVGLLWVKGKPGSGKSTLMKHAAHWMEKAEENRATVATFYFNARGEALEKTPLGLFRSILHQLCVQDSAVRAEFLNLYEDRLRRTTPGDEWSWAELELQAFMRRIFRECKPRRTFVFIDALDECELQTVREVVYFLAKVAKSAFESGICLNICLSSRHYPTISVPNCLEIVVEAGNGPDIAAYICDRFSFAPSSEAGIVAKLQSTITEKAAGVFLWVVLVVDHLLQDIDSGQSMSKLAERLKQVPRTMEELYAERCQSLSTEERDFSVPLIQWVLFGDESFKRHGFPQAAVLAAHFSASGFQPQNGLGDKISPKHERAVRRIKDASRGLIEYNTADKKVQFIHETAREFFLTGPGLSLLDPRLAENPTGLSYMALVNGCLNAIEASHELKRVQYWFYWFAGHTRSAVIHYAGMVERHGGSNIALLESIKAGRYCALEGMQKSRHLPLKPGESFLRYLARVGLTSCALDFLGQGMHPDDGGDSYSSPLAYLFSHFAFGCPDKALVQGLVKYGAYLECKLQSGNTPLLIAVSFGWVEMAEFLIMSGADVNATDESGFSVLDHAVHLRQRMLSKDNSVLSTIPGNNRPSLAECGRLLELLLARGANHNTTNKKDLGHGFPEPT